MRDYILLFYAGGEESFAGAADKGGDYGGVPTGMDDSDAERGACGGRDGLVGQELNEYSERGGTIIGFGFAWTF